jgi:hypothetical protein
VLLTILTVIEETVVGLFHQRSTAVLLGDLFGLRLEETLVGYLGAGTYPIFRFPRPQ